MVYSSNLRFVGYISLLWVRVRAETKSAEKLANKTSVKNVLHPKNISSGRLILYPSELLRVAYILDLTGMPVYFSDPSKECPSIQGCPSISQYCSRVPVESRKYCSHEITNVLNLRKDVDSVRAKACKERNRKFPPWAKGSYLFKGAVYSRVLVCSRVSV